MAAPAGSGAVAQRVFCTPPQGEARRDPAPLALVLGWWGAKDRAVAHFSRLYADRGFAVCQFTASGGESLVGEVAAAKVAEAVLSEVSRRWRCDDFSIDGAANVMKKDKPPPIVVHIMSNNGAHVYKAMLRLAARDHGWLLQGMRGVVYDCAPGSMSAGTFLRAFFAGRPPTAVKVCVFAVPLLLLALVLWLGRQHLVITIAVLLACFLCAAWRQHAFTEKYIEELASDPSTCPMLAMYSRADDLVYAEVVEDFVARRRARGINVSTHMWLTAAHVGLLLHDAKEYTEALDMFLASLQDDGWA